MKLFRQILQMHILFANILLLFVQKCAVLLRHRSDVWPVGFSSHCGIRHQPIHPEGCNISYSHNVFDCCKTSCVQVNLQSIGFQGFDQIFESHGRVS